MDNDYIKNIDKFRDLTPSEKKLLSPHLKVCFMLKGWNIGANIKCVRDWVEFAYMDFIDDYYNDTTEKAKKACNDYIDKILDFYDSYFN